MGFWRDLFLLDEPVTDVPVGQVHGSTVDFHSSTLQGLKVANSLQNGGWVDADFRASSVYRGSMLLADLVSQLPWYAYRGGDPSLTGSRVVTTSVKLDTMPTILLRPDVSTERDDVLRQIVLSLIFHGNAYLYGSMPVDGLPTNVTVVNPVEVSVTSNDGNTRPVYSWRGQTMLRGVNWWHMAMNKRPGSWLGVGPLFAGSDIVDGIRSADKYARKLFTESGTPTGVLKVPGKLTRDEADKLKAAWDTQHAGGRGTAVLSGGIEFEGISLTPEQAQFLATRAYGSQEVSRLLGIPQWFLNAGSPPGTASALTYQNLNQVFVELTRTTLYPSYLRRIESAFSALLPRGQQVKFDLSEFLRADINDRALAASQLVQAGYDATEVAEMLGLPLTYSGVPVEAVP